NRSNAVVVTVQPKTPPIVETLESLEIVPDFGGISVSYKNAAAADLAIQIETPDSTGAMAIASTFYTAREAGVFSVRGFDSEKRTFAIHVEDRWSNFSDVREVELTPLYEVMVDKSKFMEVILPGDAATTSFDGAMRNL